MCRATSSHHLGFAVLELLLWPQQRYYSAANCLENNWLFSIVPVTFKKKVVLNSSHSSGVNLILVPVFLIEVPLRNAASLAAQRNWPTRKGKRCLLSGFAADVVEYRGRITKGKRELQNWMPKNMMNLIKVHVGGKLSNQQNPAVSHKLVSVLLKMRMGSWHSLGWFFSLHVCSGWDPSWKQKRKSILVNRPLSSGQLAM